jgi:hypothetical protein
MRYDSELITRKLASFLPWRRSLIPEYREISIKRKAVKPGCHLSGSCALFALQPPDDGADQDMGELHSREFLGHGWIDRLTGFHLVFPPSLLLKHELYGVLMHPGCKPRTAVFPQHRSGQSGIEHADPTEVGVASRTTRSSGGSRPGVLLQEREVMSRQVGRRRSDDTSLLSWLGEGLPISSGRPRRRRTFYHEEDAHD